MSNRAIQCCVCGDPAPPQIANDPELTRYTCHKPACFGNAPRRPEHDEFLFGGSLQTTVASQEAQPA